MLHQTCRMCVIIEKIAGNLAVNCGESIMEEQDRFSTHPLIRVWRYFLPLIVLGLAVYLLLPQIDSMRQSWSVVRNLIWWAVGLAAIAQLFSYLGSGYIQHAILDLNQQKLSIGKGALITMAAYSIGLVAGGWVGGGAATYGWVRRESGDGHTAVLAGTLPGLLNNASLAAVAIIGLLYLLFVHDLTRVQLIEFIVILLLLGLMSGSVIAAMSCPEPAEKFAVWVRSRWAAFRKKPFSPEETVASVRQLIGAWDSLGNFKWLRPMLGSIACIGFDMLTLYFMFVAAGLYLNPGVLFAGYGLPLLLGKLAFILPGGVGVVEGSMVALFVSLMVPDPVSAVVIMGYRFFNFWLPVLLGFAAATYLSRHNFVPKGIRP